MLRVRSTFLCVYPEKTEKQNTQENPNITLYTREAKRKPPKHCQWESKQILQCRIKKKTEYR